MLSLKILLAFGLAVAFGWVVVPAVRVNPFGWLFGWLLLLVVAGLLAGCFGVQVVNSQRGFQLLCCLLAVAPLLLIAALLDEHSYLTLLRDLNPTHYDGVLPDYVPGSVERVAAGIVLTAVLYGGCITAAVHAWRQRTPKENP